MQELINLLNFLEDKGVFYIILCAIVVLFIIKPDWGKRISLVFVALFTFYKWARKANVSRSFEFKISNVTTELNKEIGEEILPTNPKIKWVKNTTREAFVNEGKVVVKLDYHDDRNRTFALATSSYVNKSLLPVARRYIPEEIMESCSLLVTRRIITDKNEDSLEFFVTDILKEVFKDKPEIEELYNELTDLDNNAMFLQILIPELWKMGKRIYPNNIKKAIVEDEIEKLIKFLHAIATKKYDQIAKLNLDSNLFKLRVILVGKMETLHGKGIDPYIFRINEGINNGYKSIYLLGYERKTGFLKEIKKRFEDHEKIQHIKIREGNVINSNFDNMKCICIGLTIKEHFEVEEKTEAS
ncbi:hypothetical protein [Gracilibacillus sp. YIM 98692]|uniref:hypothetical protein n=1 Tax=Gracilibacillus sp. YIM 98692 TaxID=2663532 RepID=UPI0013D5459C|nr:hypothetical protein [Gracilibacillus sp. YIM 98692]